MESLIPGNRIGLFAFWSSRTAPSGLPPIDAKKAPIPGVPERGFFMPLQKKEKWEMKWLKRSGNLDNLKNSSSISKSKKHTSGRRGSASKARLYKISDASSYESAIQILLCFALFFVICALSMCLAGSAEAREISVPRIVDAIYLAEGGEKARKPYGILSVPCGSKAECRRIAERTVRNNFKRWADAGAEGDYLEFLARRYAPIGAENDPKGLNENWLKNVRHFLGAK